SLGPHVALARSGLTDNGILARSVRDVASVLDLLIGYRNGDPNWIPKPSVAFASMVDDPSTYRIGLVLEQPPYPFHVSPICLGAVSEAGAILEGLGHQVESVESGLLWDSDVLHDYMNLNSVNSAFTVEGLASTLRCD